MRCLCAILSKLIARRSAPDLCTALALSFVLAQFFASPSLAYADKPVPQADLAVDQVALKGGPRLLGSVLGREADGALAFAVGREWLKKNHAKYFEKALPEETAETKAAFVELRDRIAAWRRERAPEIENQNAFDFFLKKESERVEQALKAINAGAYEENAPFMVLDLALAKIDRVVNQPPQRKQVALTAWRERLPDVETRSATSLTQELKKLKVDLVDDYDFLLDLLPPRRQNDSAWAARKAIVEYQFLKPLDFQGRGELVLKAGEQINAANAAQLFGDLLKSLGGNSLSDLLGPGLGPAAGQGGGPVAGNGGKKPTPARPAIAGWLSSASKAAEADKITGFRMTRSQEDLAAKRVTVETRFAARMPDGTWKTVWQRDVQADAAKVRADVEQQIMQDPQIKSVLELVKTIGLGGDEQIKMAVRFGAATQEAQQQADTRFFEFRDRHLHRLDGPVLRVAPAAAPKAAK